MDWKDEVESTYHQRSRRRFWRVWSLLCFALLLCGVVSAALILMFYDRLAAKYDLDRLGELRERSIVLDVKGREIGRLHGENRSVVPLEEISPYFIQALIAREDRRFYQHAGVDFIGVGRAVLRDLKERAFVQGASTLTMQLARNSFPDLTMKTAHRKMVEALLALRIERVKTKDEILELYVNRIFFGSGLYGIERASQAYFMKPAKHLTLGESAMLAGIIRGPNRFSPFRNWQGALRERDTVLQRMLLYKVINAEQVVAAKAEEIIPAAAPVYALQENYIMEAVRDDLERILSDSEIEDGGLLIHTTLDLDLQNAATSLLDAELARIEGLQGYEHMTKQSFDAQWDGKLLNSTPYLQGALMALDNRTGGVLAMVGGRDFTQNRFDRVTQSKRSIGSTVKPFVYASAFMRGMLPGTYVEDAPILPGEIAEADPRWQPANADRQYLGFIPAEAGLIGSRNAITVRVGNYAGLNQISDLLSQVGLGKPDPRNAQIYIGNMSGNLRGLTSAMSVFPNQGQRRRPYIIQAITDAAEEILYQTPILEVEVMSHGVAHMTRELLERAMTVESVKKLKEEYNFKVEAGGKTGTTNQYHDAWFVGFTKTVSCGVWVGFDSPRAIMPQGYGSRLAMPLWMRFIQRAVEHGYETKLPEIEPAVANVEVCRISSRLAVEACRDQDCAYQAKLPYDVVPQIFCEVHSGVSPVEVDDENGESPGMMRRMFRWFR